VTAEGRGARGSATSRPRRAGKFVPSLSEIPGGWTERHVQVADRAYRLILPASPDAFLDDPAVQARNRRDDYMPYWPYLWPASLKMAEQIARHPWTPQQTALEIGCGIGLVGIAALDRGLDVVFSDHQQEAVDLAVFNARQNGHPNAEGLLLDWRSPVDRKFSVILGCDVIYEAGSHAPILNLFEHMLAPNGYAWLCDPGRQAALGFVREAQNRSYRVQLLDSFGKPLSDPQIGRFQSIKLTRLATEPRSSSAPRHSGNVR
jgi:ETFB lysine methyltransferase